jgi:hypothetical protein
MNVLGMTTMHVVASSKIQKSTAYEGVHKLKLLGGS